MERVPLVDVGPTKVVVFPNLKTPHGCSTRVGGVSSGHLDSLNGGFTVGDTPDNVWENRSRFARHLGVENLPWLLSMTHGNQVANIPESAPVPSDLTSRPKTHYAADACITNQSGVPLSLTVADCVPVFFHDPVRAVIGVAHAGWRGTVSGIVEETVKAMGSHYGSQAGDIQVGVGPSIGPDSFEVGEEVASEFREAFGDQPDLIRTHHDPEAARQGKVFVNLWLANQIMAMRAGVPESNIVISGWCTVSHPELFFSHRRDKGKSGRLLAGIIQ